MKLQTPRYNWQSYNFGSISLCMIMRDSAKTLRRCLDNLVGLVDEIIIVDTGSKDDSVKIAQSYGAKVYFDAWQDDFSRPRNIGLEKATKDWILVMDPDEVLLPTDHQAMRWMTRDKNIIAWWITTHNYNNSRGDMSFRTISHEADPLGQYAGYSPSTKTRFFRNGYGIKFVGCWHELVDWYLMKNKLVTVQSDIIVHHWAHEIAQKDIQSKILFSLKMGEKKVKEWPQNGQCWWELSVAESIIGYRSRAASSLAKAFRLGFGSQGQFFAMSRILRMLGDAKKADLAFQKGVCRLYPSLTHIDPAQKPLEALLDGL